MRTKKLILAMLSVILCEIAGALGSIAVLRSVTTWYVLLNKPGFAPPNWVFGPVWLILYALIGLSAYMVWEKGKRKRYTRPTLNMFSEQLALNGIWPILFFGMRSTLYGLIDIILLWFAIIVTMVKFYKISKKAAALFFPYLLWVTFAMVLNFYIWRLN
jgi:tryptophan-rich sensory protein